jgi:aryl-alcohol dehydrogenase-like predicted oxidoreductase
MIMQLRRLGTSGTLVSELALGTMTFGDETDREAAHEILDHYVEAGGTLIDTADVYSAGVSEEIVGSWLAGRSDRGDLAVATKGRFPLSGDAGPNAHGASLVHLGRAVDASLERLGVDVIDLYQVHAWDPVTPLEETLAALDAMVRAGKVRHVGLSNYTGWQLQRAVLLARHHGWTVPITLQPQYNLLDRGIEYEVTQVCEVEGVGILPWSPLGGGWLTGKYRRDERPTGATRLGEDPERGVEAYDSRDTERTWAIVDAVREIADGHDVTPAQVALRWLAGRPQVASVILGVRTLDQLRDNLGAADLTLSDGERRRLDEVSAPPEIEYPYALLDQMTAGRRRLLD